MALTPIIRFDSTDAIIGWTTVNDDTLGGSSSGKLKFANNQLIFQGSLNTRGGGFASVRTKPKCLNLASHTGIAFKVRGDGRCYKFRLTTDQTNVSYSATFSTLSAQWITVELPFSQFLATWRGRRVSASPMDPAEIRSIGFLIADQTDGAFLLEVDWISAY